ncbi:hypothetical protein [Bacillus mycoides]|uniref:hypothetical protein n=1 Tax=Bacillus mycoides TaxID=1405 RepID=UPI0010BEE317|nr:hypothetical protein [Bacillus mycoides]TKI46678.1 hypothetical protein FC700_09450 [Bacillus mycoides]
MLKKNLTKSEMKSNILVYAPSALAALLFAVGCYLYDYKKTMVVFLFLFLFNLIQTYRYIKKIKQID